MRILRQGKKIIHHEKQEYITKCIYCKSKIAYKDKEILTAYYPGTDFDEQIKCPFCKEYTPVYSWWFRRKVKEGR